MAPEKGDLTLNPSFIRSTVLIVGLVLFTVIETVRPYRKPATPRAPRWAENLGLALVNVTFVGTIVGHPIVTKALTLGSNPLRSLPPLLHGLLALLILDAGHYLWHRASHRVPLLWRLHRVHHCDRDMDISTYMRFHPLELSLGLIVKALLIVLSGVTPLQLVTFEILFNTAAQFHHSSLALPGKVEKALVALIVPPCMHRVHHSVIIVERDSNYGTILSLWDRLFGSFRLREDVPAIRMGVGGHKDVTGFTKLMVLPFRPPVR